MQHSRLRWLISLGLIVGLVALLGWWQPWRSTPTLLKPQPTTPPPTPTLTPASVTLVASPTSQPMVAGATPSNRPAATPGQRTAPGRILYMSYLNGQEGIVTANADGTGQRLLVPGRYQQIVWNDAGTRFAATGPLPDSNTTQLAIFNYSGQALARFSIEGVGNQRLTWSPTGDAVAFTTHLPPGVNNQPAEQRLWVATVEGVQAISGLTDRLSWFSWTAAGELLITTVVTNGDSTTLWRLPTPDSTPQRVTNGQFVPIGPELPGRFLYAAGRTHAAPGVRYQTLLLIDLKTGDQRTFLHTDQIPYNSAVQSAQHSISYAALSPDGLTLAMIIGHTITPGTPVPGATPPASGPATTLLFLQAYQLAGGVPFEQAFLSMRDLDAGINLGLMQWSPDSNAIALVSALPVTTRLQIISLVGVERVSYEIELYASTFLTWSPDSEWLTTSPLIGLEILSATEQHRYQLTPDGSAPAWYPRVGP